MALDLSKLEDVVTAIQADIVKLQTDVPAAILAAANGAGALANQTAIDSITTSLGTVHAALGALDTSVVPPDTSVVPPVVAS